MISGALCCCSQPKLERSNKTERHIWPKHLDLLLTEPNGKHASLSYYQPNRYNGNYSVLLWCRNSQRNNYSFSHSTYLKKVPRTDVGIKNKHHRTISASKARQFPLQPPSANFPLMSFCTIKTTPVELLPLTVWSVSFLMICFGL